MSICSRTTLLQEFEDYVFQLKLCGGNIDPYGVIEELPQGIDVNKEVFLPTAYVKSLGFECGAIRIMMDDDFYEAACLPMKFCTLTLKILCEKLWPGSKPGVFDENIRIVDNCSETVSR